MWAEGLVLISFVWSVCGILSSSERAAVIDFARGLNLDVNVSTNPCSWSGFTCDPNQNFIEGIQFITLGIQGTISEWIGNLTNLQKLSLYQNEINGTLPQTIGFLTSLDTFALFTNKLSGTIPPSIGKMTFLTNIQLHENQFSGTIPEIGDLTSLQELSLYKNQLSGTIMDVGKLTSLTRLILSTNQLSGTIPQSIGNLTLLTAIDISVNQISGSIPESIGSLVNLNYLELYNNNLIGSIPESIGSLVNLNYLDLNSNNLINSIPKSIRNNIDLSYLDLHSNNLIGSIPEFLGKVNLVYLDLSSNSLTGSIPPSLSNLTFYVDLSSNQLTGTISKSFEDFKIPYLDISSNRIIGMIPNISPNSNLSLLSSNASIQIVAVWKDYWRNYNPETSFDYQFGLSCGVITFNCVPHPSKCILSCSNQNPDFNNCEYPCNLSFDPIVQLNNLSGFSPIYLNNYEETVNISSTEVEMNGNGNGLSIHSLNLLDSSVIVNDFLSSINGTMFLQNSNLIIKGIATIVGTSITFGDNSIIQTLNSVQIKNTTFYVHFNSSKYSTRELIHLNNSFSNDIDLSSINLQITNTNQNNLQNCYHLQKSDVAIVVSQSCESSNSINSALIGGIVGGILGVVVLAGIVIFVKSYYDEKESLQSLSLENK